MAVFVLLAPTWWAVFVCRLLGVAIVWNVGIVFSICGGTVLVWEIGVLVRVMVSVLCCVTGVVCLLGLVLGVSWSGVG